MIQYRGQDQTEKRISKNILHEWIHTKQPKLWLINPWDTETADTWKEDGRMTYEDSYTIGTGLWVCLDDNDEYS
jgi:hypothetical protein